MIITNPSLKVIEPKSKHIGFMSIELELKFNRPTERNPHEFFYR